VYCSRCGTWTPDSSSTCARCGEARAPQAPVPVVEGLEVVATPSVPEPVAPPAPAVHYAGFWRRVAAMLVDVLLLFFPGTILRVGVGMPPPWSPQPMKDGEMGLYLTVFAITTVFTWLYSALLESSRWRGTLGQQLLDMRVGDGRDRRISFGRATARYFAQYLSAALCLVGYLFNLWTPRRQTLHDMVAGCVFVVPAREPAPGVVVMTGNPS
jgi:uncharacterized RDD family membrane protein YckC